MKKMHANHIRPTAHAHRRDGVPRRCFRSWHAGSPALRANKWRINDKEFLQPIKWQRSSWGISKGQNRCFWEEKKKTNTQLATEHQKDTALSPEKCKSKPKGAATSGFHQQAIEESSRTQRNLESQTLWIRRQDSATIVEITWCVLREGNRIIIWLSNAVLRLMHRKNFKVKWYPTVLATSDPNGRQNTQTHCSQPMECYPSTTKNKKRQITDTCCHRNGA